MKNALAERLLAEVMGWSPEDVARERPVLQAMASYKYDEYQQFSPGMRFVESFALWLSQFKTQQEKELAFRFVMSQLIFCSSAEVNHLVSIVYADHIRPLLLRNAASEVGLNERHIAKVVNSDAFKVRQRQCLFLGLSDGARIDIFRRYNGEYLSHEQVWQTYEISRERVVDLLDKLKSDLEHLLGGNCSPQMQKFRTVVLLDDFSASGISYLRRKDDGTFAGKIAKFYRSITDKDNPASALVTLESVEIFVVLYMATDQAREHLENLSKELWESLGVKCSIIVTYPLHSEVCIKPGQGHSIESLLDAYYDPSIEDDHTSKGGTNLKYGFAQCGLPLILSHNTPNNTLSLLWARSRSMRPLFPRISRHVDIQKDIGKKV